MRIAKGVAFGVLGGLGGCYLPLGVALLGSLTDSFSIDQETLLPFIEVGALAGLALGARFGLRQRRT